MSDTFDLVYYFEIVIGLSILKVIFGKTISRTKRFVCTREKKIGAQSIFHIFMCVYIVRLTNNV